MPQAYAHEFKICAEIKFEELTPQARKSAGGRPSGKTGSDADPLSYGALGISKRAADEMRKLRDMPHEAQEAVAAGAHSVANAAAQVKREKREPDMRG